MPNDTVKSAKSNLFGSSFSRWSGRTRRTWKGVTRSWLFYRSSWILRALPALFLSASTLAFDL